MEKKKDRKDPEAGRDQRHKEKEVAEDEMIRQHHWLNGRKFEQTLGDGEGQGNLVCCSPWGHKEWIQQSNRITKQAKSLQQCPTLCNPKECSPPGCSVHGILQARTLEWLAMPSSRGSSRPRGQNYLLGLLHWQVGSLPLAPAGKPH